MNLPPNVPLMVRIRLIGYGLIGGLIAGAVFGWMFHSLIGFIFRAFLLLAAMGLVVAAIMFWQRVTSRPSPTRSNDVREADWVELEANSRPRR
jgi:predicted lipid-binding transport protein (Tim44 family)